MIGVSLIMALYVVYMLNYFKTTVNIAHPLTEFENDMFYHPIEYNDVPQNMICTFGNYGAFILAGFIIYRSMYKCNKIISHIIVICVFLLSLLNFNACLYLLPYFIFEMFYFIRV